VIGAELVFAIEALGTRVAMVRVLREPPALLLAEHLHGDQPILVYGVTDLEQVIADLQARGAEIRARFEIPMGPASSSSTPGPCASRSTSRRGPSLPIASPAGEISERRLAGNASSANAQQAERLSRAGARAQEASQRRSSAPAAAGTRRRTGRHSPSRGSTGTNPPSTEPRYRLISWLGARYLDP